MISSEYLISTKSFFYSLLATLMFIFFIGQHFKLIIFYSSLKISKSFNFFTIFILFLPSFMTDLTSWTLLQYILPFFFPPSLHNFFFIRIYILSSGFLPHTSFPALSLYSFHCIFSVAFSSCLLEISVQMVHS